MGLLEHQELAIIKGIGIVPGDTSSAEQAPVVLNLLDTAAGFSLVEWTPNIPSLKGGGLWADSPISDGRTLVSGVNTNVTETIVVQLTGATLQNYAAQFAKLQRMVQDARDFWDTFNQIEPVYLKWWASGAPGPQYALIYNIDMDVEWQDDPVQAQSRITLTIERESYWRGIAPGDNPKKWTIEEFFTGQDYSTANADLLSGLNHLATQLVQNRYEWNTTQSALLSQNYLDIPATAIPGDAPALVELTAECVTAPVIGLSRLYVGKSSKPDLTASGVTRKPNYILNAADGASFGADTADAADTGAPIRSATGANRRINVTFATVTTDAARVEWNPTAVGTYFDLATLRGRFAAFLRARLSAASTVALHLSITDYIGTLEYPTVNLTATGSGGTGNTTYWPVLYMGQLSFPFNEQGVVVGNDGLGVDVVTVGVIPQFQLFARRVGAAVTLYIADLILIPIDEGVIMQEAGGLMGAGNQLIYDNTGYYLHGKPGTYMSNNFLYTSGFSGSDLYLTPKVRNRLVVFLDNPISGTPAVSAIDASYRLRVNIIPRWSGIRDT